MFCRFCGSTLPDDSTFCQSCGKSLSAGTSAANSSFASATARPASIPGAGIPREAKRKQNPAALGLALSVLLAAVVWWGANSQRASSAKGPQGGSSTLIPIPQPHNMKIGTGALTVKALEYDYFTLIVPVGAKTVRLQGHFSAAGGSGNDIEVFVLNEDQYINWQNGHSTPTFFNSGRVTAYEVNAVLPDGAGTYYLVFNNKFSLMTPKAVEDNLTLTYYQ